MARRCFISAPADVAVAPLIAALKARGWEPFVLSDVATLGVSLTEAVQDAIRRADVVIALFGEDTSSSPNTAFEVGFAVALEKPVLLFVSPGADVPSDLRSFLYVQADPGNMGAVVLALDNLDRYTGQLYPEKSPLSTAAPLGQYADYLLDEARTLRHAPAAKFEDLVRRAIEASGALAVASPAPDRGFDIGVWSDDLDAIGGNPLLIELKHHVNEQSAGVSVTARNEMNAFDAEEIDIAFWNEGAPNGLRLFDHLLLVECKNWSAPVGYPELAVFYDKLQSRGRPIGILVAARGITGDRMLRTAAHEVLVRALANGREILVLTRREIERVRSTDELIELLKRKRAQLTVSATIYELR